MGDLQAGERSDAGGGAWDSAFLRARLLRVMELPLPPEGGGGKSSGDAFGLQRRGGLSALFHGGGLDGRGLVWGWLRGARSGPVELLSSEPVLAPAGSGLVPAPGAVELLEGIGSWAEVAIRPVGFGSTHDDPDRHGPRDDAPERGSVSSVESVLLRVWDRPFTLLVMAVPVEREEAEAVAERAADGMRYAGQRRERSPELSVVYDRLAWWHREVLSGASSGLWWVRLLTGGQSGREALELAGLAAASFGAGELGYELVPLTAGREERLSFLHASVMSGAGGGDHADNRSARGFLAGTGLLAALTRPPATEVPGVRQVLPSTFDTTSEHPAGRGVGLGVLLDGQRRAAGRMVLPFASLNRHGLIPGATGSGKSMTARAVTEGLIADGVPVCAIEPAKAEWATALAARLPDVEVVRIAPGDPGQVAACIDPMRPVEGFALQTHIDLVRSLFLAAFDADEPFPQVLSAALQRAYERQGWNTLLSTPSGGAGARYPTLADLQAAAAEVVREVGYGPEVHQNIQGFIKVRLSALRLGTSGRFLEGGHPIDMKKLLSSNVVLEIQDVGDDAEKAFIIGAFLLKLTEHYRVAERRGEIEPGVLRHVTVIEEAHRLLRNPEGHAAAGNRAVEMFAALLAEVRAYGEGVLVCEQIPSKLIPDTIKNTSVKICHRLPAQDDRDLVGATMNLTPAQSEFLVTVRPGEAAVFADGMDRPVLIRVPDATTRERSTASTPVGPAGLTEPVFGRCAAAYGLEDVSLGTVARARELLDRTPMAICWVEFAVLAHLTGRIPPRPSLEVSWTLADEVWRTAIVLAVDDAVAARSEHLRDRIPPAGLAAHLAHALTEMVQGGAACGHEPEWIATPWLLDRPAHELAKHRADHPGGLECGNPHPDTGLWQTTYGPVPSATCADQHIAIETWRRRAQTDREIEDLIFGTTTPAALDQTAGFTRADDGWAARIGELADGFDVPWAVPILAPGPGRVGA